MRRLSWVAGAAATLALVACGEEKTFSAEEFVEQVGEHGVEVQRGEELFSDDEDKEIYAVELAPLPGGLGPKEGALGHSEGSLSVHEDVEGADEQMDNCEASADLLCFQASNIVVVLEGGGIEAQRLGLAMEKLGD